MSLRELLLLDDFSIEDLFCFLGQKRYASEKNFMSVVLMLSFHEKFDLMGTIYKG